MDRPLAAPFRLPTYSLTTSPSRPSMLFMSVALLVVAAVVLGYKVAHWWVVSLPALLGITAAGMLIANGVSLDDTPLPFAVGLSTIAVVGGVAHRRSLAADTEFI
jgi:hypothetical protein